MTLSRFYIAFTVGYFITRMAMTIVGAYIKRSQRRRTRSARPVDLTGIPKARVRRGPWIN